MGATPDTQGDLRGHPAGAVLDMRQVGSRVAEQWAIGRCDHCRHLDSVTEMRDGIVLCIDCMIAYLEECGHGRG